MINVFIFLVILILLTFGLINLLERELNKKEKVETKKESKIYGSKGNIYDIQNKYS